MADAKLNTAIRKYSAPAAACAADVLITLARADGEALSVPQLSEQTEHTKSLVYRVLAELEQRSLVVKDASGGFRLGLAVVELGGTFTETVPFMTSVRSILKQIAAETGETVNFGVRRDDRVLYLLREEGEHSVVTLSHVGKLLPATATGLGKALLAQLSDDQVRELFSDRKLVALTSRSITSVRELIRELSVVREVGHAEEHEESVLGRGCIAVACVLPQQPSAPVAISLSFSAERFSELRERAVEALSSGRQAILQQAQGREALGNWPSIGALPF